MTSTEIKSMLFQRYLPPEFAFFTEVANSTGSLQSRYADAIAYALWPSKGFEIIGFEIKVSRSDFLYEMKNPSKSQAVMRYCHRWYLVAPKGIATKEELPANWGFYEIGGDRFYTRKVAPLLTPEVCDSGFIAALLRRSTENSIPREHLNKFKQDAEDRWKEFYSKELDREKNRYNNICKRVDDFEKSSGVKIDYWGKTGEEIGKALKFVLDGEFSSIKWNVSGAISDFENIIEKMKEYQTLLKLNETK